MGSRFTSKELYDIDLHLANTRAELKLALDIMNKKLDPEFSKGYNSLKWRLDQVYETYHTKRLNRIKWEHSRGGKS